MTTYEGKIQDAIDADQIHGTVFAKATRSGSCQSGAIGSRTLLDGSKVALDAKETIVFVASCTKLVTTIAALQCVEKGLLSLDADLRPQLPALTDRGVLTDASATKDGTIVPVKKPLTLRHLLTHSSGLSYDIQNPITKRWREAHPYEKQSGKTVAERFLLPLLFQPGEGWEYGCSLDWAGYLVEECTGSRLDEYIRRNILEPLEIAPTNFTFFPVAEGLLERMSDVNLADPNGFGLAVTVALNIHEADSTACCGGSGAYATAEALVKILSSLLRNDGNLLSSESVTEMHKPQLEPLALEAFNHDHVSTLAIDEVLDKRTDRDHGLGGILITQEQDSTGLGKGSLTWGGGINSAWAIDPVHGTCGFSAPQLKAPSPPKIPLAMDLSATFVKELANDGLKTS